tara:strand:- start:1894 stop:3873 length:1980 start_codon:yes stop_codon:yes gene_type:complete
MTRGLILISVAITVIFFSCKPSTPTIITVGNQSIKTDEFKYIYEKNHSKDHDRYSKESLDNYLDLFINYRLKVLEAETQKLDSTPAFQTELTGYKKQLAKPYFADDLMTEELAKEAYIRSKTAVKARHILIQVKETASPQDTLHAYSQIEVIRDSIVKGADFGQMAYQFSQDPSAKSIQGKPGYKGNLGYFSSMRMVYAFENAAFNTPKNETSKIIRTKFGYHILQVQDIVTMEYKAKVAHIMIKAPNGLSKEDSLERINRTTFVYQQLQNGGNWDTLCRQYSDHTNTKNEGGILPAFTLGGSLGLPVFELASYNLKTVGEISRPIKTPYGWHIIQLKEKVPFQTYQAEKEDFVSKVKKDDRSEQNQTALASKLKSENGFKENKEKDNLLKAITDEKIITKNWNIEDHSESLQKELFMIEKKSYSVYDFGQYIEENQKMTTKGAKEYMILSMYTDFVSTSLITFEEQQLPNKYFDYKMIIQEFHDGILIYDLMKMQVWDKANQDTSGLRTFFNDNKANYTAPDKITGAIYTIIDINQTVQIKTDIDKGIGIDSILNKYNTDSITAVTIQSGTFIKGEYDLLASVTWDLDNKVEIHELAGIDYIIQKEAIHVNENYNLNQVRGRVVADYQQELETNFIKELKTRYPVKVIDKEYNKLIKY